jgi:hypothetical protein
MKTLLPLLPVPSVVVELLAQISAFKVECLSQYQPVQSASSSFGGFQWVAVREVGMVRERDLVDYFSKSETACFRLSFKMQRHIHEPPCNRCPQLFTSSAALDVSDSHLTSDVYTKKCVTVSYRLELRFL